MHTCTHIHLNNGLTLNVVADPRSEPLVVKLKPTRACTASIRKTISGNSWHIHVPIPLAILDAATTRLDRPYPLPLQFHVSHHCPFAHYFLTFPSAPLSKSRPRSRQALLPILATATFPPGATCTSYQNADPLPTWASLVTPRPPFPSPGRLPSAHPSFCALFTHRAARGTPVGVCGDCAL